MIEYSIIIIQCTKFCIYTYRQALGTALMQKANILYVEKNPQQHDMPQALQLK